MIGGELVQCWPGRCWKSGAGVLARRATASSRYCSVSGASDKRHISSRVHTVAGAHKDLCFLLYHCSVRSASDRSTIVIRF